VFAGPTLAVMRVAVAVSVLGGLLAFGAPPAGATGPDTTTPLPGHFSAMLVDPTTNHVFVSVSDDSKIAVFDLDGNPVTTIAGEAGAAGLALVGSKLYVVAANAGAIDEIDTGTLTRTRTLTSGLPNMHDIVAAGGALWVNSFGDLVKVSLTNGAQTEYANPISSGNWGIVADPADPNTVVVYTPDSSPVTLGRIDISTSPPTLKARANTTVENVQNVAVSPDGTRLVPAGGAPYQFDEFAMSNLALTGVVYPANPYPRAVAMTAAGGGVFAGGMDGIYENDVVVYRLDDPSTLLASYDFGTTSATVLPGGLAFSPLGSVLYVATADNELHVLHLPVTPSPAPIRSLSVTPAAIPFGSQRVATHGEGRTVTLENTGNVPLSLQDLALDGGDRYNFYGTTDCFPQGKPRSLAPGARCHATLFFGPLRAGPKSAELKVSDDAPDAPQSVVLTGRGTEGYFIAGARGEVGAFGDAVYHGSAARTHLAAKIVAIATTPNGAGYWLVGGDGGVFSYGNARFFGSTGARHLHSSVVGMARTTDGKGYWLLTSAGGVFAFGDAHSYGSAGSVHSTFVGITPTQDGRGYWLAGADGRVQPFGDAHSYGSAAGRRLTAPIIRIAGTPRGHGYWLLTADGHVYGFGDGHGYGATVGRPTVGFGPTSDGYGYWEVTRGGAVSGHGDARTYGDLTNIGVDDVVDIAPTAPPLPPPLVTFAQSGVQVIPRA